VLGWQGLRLLLRRRGRCGSSSNIVVGTSGLVVGRVRKCAGVVLVGRRVEFNLYGGVGEAVCGARASVIEEG
jgi:hypothetical protein